MFARRCVQGVLVLCLSTILFGCSSSGLDSVQITPTTQSLAVGQTAQFNAVGTFGNAKHATTGNITNSVTWNSSAPSVATINASGVATAVGPGTTTITAGGTAYNGPTSASATLTVTGSGGGTAGSSIASISVIPGSQSVASPSQTSQFIAIGTTSSGATENLTNLVGWSSSSTQIATVGASTGLATGVSQGTTTIAALYTDPKSGTSMTGTATFTVVGGKAEQFTAVAITPSSPALSAGQTTQLIALATAGSTGLQTDVTSSTQIQWRSSSPSIASVTATGLITGASAGNATITAELMNADSSVVSGTATVAVSNTPAPEPLLSLTIIPSSITVGNLQDTGNFLAFGTFSAAPYVRDLTNSVTWRSAAPDVFPVSSNNSVPEPVGATAGVVTAYGNGGATIIAQATSSDGSVQTATATFNCPLVLPNPPTTAGSCFPGSQAPALKATITVYNEGLNTTNWEVTAPSATGTPDVIHCGPGWPLNGGTGGIVCAAPYPIDPTGSTLVKVILTAQGGAFGGWSWSCTPSDQNGNPIPPTAITAAGPNYCTVTLSPSNPNVTVGAIFNN
jgi:uncharacterized protein YjdB